MSWYSCLAVFQISVINIFLEFCEKVVEREILTQYTPGEYWLMLFGGKYQKENEKKEDKRGKTKYKEKLKVKK
jgi:hypothetical protein